MGVASTDDANGDGTRRDGGGEDQAPLDRQPRGGEEKEQDPLESSDRAENDSPRKTVAFPKRLSLIQQILSRRSLQSPSSTEPKRTAMKSYNQDSLVIDDEEIAKFSTHNFHQSEHEFFAEFDFSEVMIKTIQAKCSTTYQSTVLLDNCSAMKRCDAKLIQGSIEKYKRLAGCTDCSLVSCPRFEALKDICFFLICLAATVSVPTTFELFQCKKKIGGRGRGFRRIGSATAGDNTKSSAEDYIDLGDQAESALELIENFKACIIPSQESFQGLIEDVKLFHNGNRFKIESEEGTINVLIITCRLPWGSTHEEAGHRAKFVELLNSFTDLPVTFVFLIETSVYEIVEFYDSLLLPGSGVKADLKVAKGLGHMVSGIQEHNPWLNYCLPFHICQVLGICTNILSQAARRPLRADEVRVLCNTLIGDVPDPDTDLGAFFREIEAHMSNNEHTKWSPARGSDFPLIEMVSLKKQLSKKPARGQPHSAETAQSDCCILL